MIPLAAAHSPLAWFGLTALGLILFGGVATVRTASPIPAFSLITLTLLNTGWLFAAGLVWKQAGVTRVRFDNGWAHHEHAWQWTALLMLSFAGVIAVALALRGFSTGRTRLGSCCGAVACFAFAAWSAIVSFSVVLAVFCGALGLAAIAVANWNAPGSVPSSSGALRTPLIILTTVAALTAGGVLFVFSIPTGG